MLICFKFTQLNNNLGTLSFGQNDDGKWGYKVGASTEIIPFSVMLSEADQLGHGYDGHEWCTVTANVTDYKIIILLAWSYDNGMEYNIPKFGTLLLSYLWNLPNNPNRLNIRIFANTNDDTSFTAGIKSNATTEMYVYGLK